MTSCLVWDDVISHLGRGKNDLDRLPDIGECAHLLERDVELER
jgi:hypothetical protein